MSTQSQSQIATYKGRKYRLAWMGATKYGQRAKLQFFDGSREFWADAAAVSVSTSHHESREEQECELCGRNKYTCGHCIGW